MKGGARNSANVGSYLLLNLAADHPCVLLPDYRLMSTAYGNPSTPLI